MNKITTLVFSFVLFFAFFSTKTQAQFSIGFHAFENEIHNASWERISEGTGYSLELIGKEHLKKFFLNIRFGLHVDYIPIGKKKYVSPGTRRQFEYKLYNHALSGHLFVRVITKASKVRFYGDAQAGYRSFFTYDYLKTVQWNNTFPVEETTTTEHEDFPISTKSPYTGIAAGMQYRVFKWLYADLRLTQNIGGYMEYAETNSIEHLRGDFSPIKKSTRFYTQKYAQIGLEIRMGGNDSKCKKAKKPEGKMQKIQQEKDRKSYKIKIENPNPNPKPESKPKNKTLFNKG